MKRCVLVGIAGDDRSYSLSLFNLAAYALQEERIRKNWEIYTLQSVLLPEKSQWLDIAGRVKEFSPDLVGFSCYLWNLEAFKVIGKSVRESGAKVVWGGPEMAWDWASAGKFDGFPADYLVCGEGEQTFSEFLLSLTGGCHVRFIPGLCWRKDNGFEVNPKRPPLGSLDRIPSPYLLGLVPPILMSRQANIETQRGCSLRCSYCIYHKDMDRISYAPVDRVLAELDWCVENGANDVRFVDANFSSDLGHAKRIMRGLVERNYSLRLMFELIPGWIDEELSDLFGKFIGLHEGNAIQVGLGVQTVNLEILRKMRRAIRVEKFEITFDLLKANGVESKIDLILGLPGETEESWNRTLEFMCAKLGGSKKHFLCCHLLRGLPGTELVRMSEQYKQIFTDRDRPHELYESPAMPRPDMLRALRRTAVAHRVMNSHSWWESTLSSQDIFHKIRRQLETTYVDVLDSLVDLWMRDLPEDSRFRQGDFPNPEEWWDNEAWKECPEWVLMGQMFSFVGIEAKRVAVA